MLIGINTSESHTRINMKVTFYFFVWNILKKKKKILFKALMSEILSCIPEAKYAALYCFVILQWVFWVVWNLMHFPVCCQAVRVCTQPFPTSGKEKWHLNHKFTTYSHTGIFFFDLSTPLRLLLYVIIHHIVSFSRILYVQPSKIIYWRHLSCCMLSLEQTYMFKNN